MSRQLTSCYRQNHQPHPNDRTVDDNQCERLGVRAWLAAVSDDMSGRRTIDPRRRTSVQAVSARSAELSWIK